jgi:hypothetical protein
VSSWRSASVRSSAIDARTQGCARRCGKARSSVASTCPLVAARVFAAPPAAGALLRVLCERSARARALVRLPPQDQAQRR